MATQGDKLLSKVAKFVRNPNTDWSDLAKDEPARDSEQGKQALRLMIERKRHNDAVRRREFDHLRKLRQASVAVKAELVNNPLEFRGSTGYSDLGERATTLKKIDEIEAQMSHQWWKGRPANGVPKTPTSPDHLHSGLRSSFASTQNSDLLPGSDELATQTGVEKSLDFQPTQVGGQAAAVSSRGFDVSGHSVFSDSKMMSVDMGQNLSDPELEEAAIRYANGDDEGAETVLLAALANQGALADAFEAWLLALFDFYRCTGQQDKFEKLALESAQRFGRSAPGWFSTPEALGLTAVNMPQNVKSSAVTAPAWRSPAELDAAAVARLRAMTLSANQPSCVNWHDLQTVAANAAAPLAELLAFWCEQPFQLCLEGVDSLRLLLQASTPMEDRSVPFSWWQCRLDLLRLLQQPEEFEQVALDFCVTFEVSPPSWVAPRCVLVANHLNANLGSPANAHEFNDLPMGTALPSAVELPGSSAGNPSSLFAASQQPAQALTLSGEVLGDIESLTAAFQAAALGQPDCLVSCAQLIRVDFSAAGSLLNWVAQMEAQGARVAFQDVPRLVGAFFNLIGINEHARIAARNN